MGIEEIIAALETATGPSRELDAAIDISITGGSAADLAYVLEPMQGEQAGASIERTLRPLSYTASIDAALTLVPEGWTWKLLSYGSGKNFGAFLEDDMSNEVDHQVYPAPSTPALALCIAALRARQILAVEGSE